MRMGKVISGASLEKITASFKNQGKKIVLAGGCFDILHPGHIAFLKNAKKEGDILVVMLESDEKVTLLKGSNRPVQNQKERALLLSSLIYVDYILLLPVMKTEDEYDSLIKKIKPDVVVSTKGDSNSHLHQRSAKNAGAVFKFVTNMVGNYSTTKILSK